MKMMLKNLTVRLILFALGATLLNSCAMYKTRRFQPKAPVVFDNYEVTARIVAFEYSSGATWDIHDYTVSAEILHRAEWEPTVHTANIVKMALYKDTCSDGVEIDLDKTEYLDGAVPQRYIMDPIIRAHGEREYAGKVIAIDKKVRRLCMDIDVVFTHQITGKVTRKNYQFNSKRDEGMFPFLMLM